MKLKYIKKVSNKTHLDKNPKTTCNLYEGPREHLERLHPSISGSDAPKPLRCLGRKAHRKA